MDRRTFVVDGDYARVDAYLALVTELSRSHLQKLIDGGNVTVNGECCKCKRSLRTGDVICVDFPDPEEVSLEPENIPIDVVYQDEDIAVINKQQGLTVHAGNGVKSGTLVNALLYHLDSLSGINGVIRPGIVHRIDKDTSGLLVVAKNDKAHLSLSSQIAEKSCGRTYVALLNGVMSKDEGHVETYIERSPRDRTMMAVSDKGRLAVTDYTVLERLNGYTLCEFRLHTGRTHQIRVHSRHLGHSVVGDKTYGPKTCKFNLEGQLLHAYKLELTHPTTGKRMTFTAPLPEYFTKVLSALSSKYNLE